jgi:hypothetical protein
MICSRVLCRARVVFRLNEHPINAIYTTTYSIDCSSKQYSSTISTLVHAYPHLEPIVHPGAIGVDWREAILADDTLDSARHLCS